MDVPADVQAFLAAQGLVDGETGWPSVRGPMHERSDRLVGVMKDGGGEPEIPAATGIGDSALRDPGVQVRVRAERRNWDAARQKEEAIFAALHGQLAGTLGETSYLRVSALGEAAEFQDEGERPNVTRSYRLLAPV